MLDTLDYGTQSRRRVWRRWLFNLVTVLGVLLIGVTILLPSLCRPSGSANRVKSASNLRQIGQAILLYADTHADAYPPDLRVLLTDEDITADVFVSPSSNDTAAVGPTTRAVADQLLTPGHCSYTYLGRGLSTKSVPDAAVVAYESPPNVTTGGNVLFGDGHVEWFDAPWFGRLHASLERRPPSSTQPVVLPG